MTATISQPAPTMVRADEWLEKAIRKAEEGPAHQSMAERIFAQALKIENDAYAAGDRRA